MNVWIQFGISSVRFSSAMDTVTITARGFPTLEGTLDDDGQAVEMLERDERGDVIQR